VSEHIELSFAGRLLEGLGFVTVKSEALRGRADITFFVPPQAQGSQAVPLCILLHGAHGSHWNWAIKGGAHRTALRLMSQHLLPPLVMAMPSDGLWGDGSGYLPHAEQDFEKWIMEDVPAATRTVAACVSADSPVFLCGLSMGGFGALRIGTKYPNRFRGLAAHSSITELEQMKTYIEEDPESFGTPPDDRSVLETILRNRATLPPIRFDCGLDDPLLEYNRRLHWELDAHGIPHRYDEFSGGHDWNYWATHVEDSLRFFGEILSAQNQS